MLQLLYREICLKTLSICQDSFRVTEHVADPAYLEFQKAFDKIPYQKLVILSRFNSQLTTRKDEYLSSFHTKQGSSKETDVNRYKVTYKVTSN